MLCWHNNLNMTDLIGEVIWELLLKIIDLVGEVVEMFSTVI